VAVWRPSCRWIAERPHHAAGGTTPRSRSVCRAGVHSAERTPDPSPATPCWPICKQSGWARSATPAHRTDDVRERIRIMLT
jgi:hypothetical protein